VSDNRGMSVCFSCGTEVPPGASFCPACARSAGSGKRLFAEGRTPSSPRLVDVTSTAIGVTMQTFELAGPPEYGEVGVE
jgi:hypothetical protein